ncbi:transposase [Burkholderia ubonensis]|nr:transposase [Burkholderia ubonensis]KVP58821.1 transposase [Burkholderia ubonensis]KVT95095.1 transposase [Burkholderia ubonensis]KWB67791.1 transposase [Burkholderia ubonensis]KWC06142.1 transposase [Burkholderia ubonensis]
MKCVVMLNEADDLTLQQLSINHRHRDFRTRAAGLLMLASKVRPAEVAAKLSVSDQSIYNWARAWREQGVVGLLVGHKGGWTRALPDEMADAAAQFAQAGPLTLGQIAQRLEATFNEPLPCRLETLSAALKRRGFSFKRNRWSVYPSCLNGFGRTIDTHPSH